MLLNAIREGIKPSAIAAFFLEQGWLTVSEKTFVQYIQAYKRTYPDEIQRDDDEKSLNHHVDPRQPALDEETVLEQLIRTQKNRIGIALKFEKDTSIPQQHLHKDINATADLVTKLAALRGRLAGPGRPTHEVHPLSGEAKDALRKVDQSEHKQEKIVGMIGRLGSLIAAKQNARADQG